MRKFARASSLVLLSLGVALLVTQAVNAARGGHINVASVSGSINPASADYLIESNATSERDGAAALVTELDTPGGLVASTPDILQAMRLSRHNHGRDGRTSSCRHYWSP